MTDPYPILVHISPNPNPALTRSADGTERPCDEDHTPDPDGYCEWHEWAEEMSKTHRQVTCPRCGLWAIWLPKAEAKVINDKRKADFRKVHRLVDRKIKSDRKERDRAEAESFSKWVADGKPKP